MDINSSVAVWQCDFLNLGVLEEGAAPLTSAAVPPSAAQDSSKATADGDSDGAVVQSCYPTVSLFRVKKYRRINMALYESQK